MTNNNSGYVDHLLASFHPLSQSLQTAGPPDWATPSQIRRVVIKQGSTSAAQAASSRPSFVSLGWTVILRKTLLVNVYSRKLLITAPRDITTDKVDVLQSCGSTELWNGFSFLSPHHCSDTKFNFFPDYFAVCSSTAQKILHKNPPALMRSE